MTPRSRDLPGSQILMNEQLTLLQPEEHDVTTFFSLHVVESQYRASLAIVSGG
jgi:hypothetical protein